MDTSKQIWLFLKSHGLNDYGAAGLMGNLYAESGLNPQNLQNSYEKKLGYTDATYTAAVDSGAYSNFVRDSAGYGPVSYTHLLVVQIPITTMRAPQPQHPLFLEP